MKQMVLRKIKNGSSKAWINGFIGVVVFSGSLPATRIAVLAFDPVFVTAARASIAGTLSLMALLVFKVPAPRRKQLLPLSVVALGVVVGYPMLSAWALQYIDAARSIVYVGLLPLATAIFAIIRGRERPRLVFWFFSLTGSLLVAGYALAQGTAASAAGDLLMLGAIVLCGLGYAEGATLTRTLGGWQVICWALVLSLPVMLPLTFIYMPASFDGIAAGTWISLAYVSLFSMLIGFFFWYRGLAQGGIANVGQLQLLQPFLGLALATILLHEEVSMGMLAVTTGVILCVFGTKRFAGNKPFKS